MSERVCRVTEFASSGEDDHIGGAENPIDLNKLATEQENRAV